jgi:predicted DNA-binding transcriptional regulator YafY
MDELSMLLMALSAGAAASGQEVLNEMAKDAYHKLLDKVKERFAHKPKAQVVLADYQEDPDTYEKPLRKVIAQEGLDRDAEIIQAAEAVMRHVQPQQLGTGKINVQITGNAQGLAIGDQHHVNMRWANDD